MGFPADGGPQALQSVALTQATLHPPPESTSVPLLLPPLLPLLLLLPVLLPLLLLPLLAVPLPLLPPLLLPGTIHVAPSSSLASAVGVGIDASRGDQSPTVTAAPPLQATSAPAVKTQTLSVLRAPNSMTPFFPGEAPQLYSYPFVGAASLCGAGQQSYATRD